jgi:hypothetical protein
MRSLQVASHFTNTELQGKLAQSRGTSSHTRWQIILL